MPSLSDANVLLALCHRRHMHHVDAMRWLDGIQEDNEITICRFSQLALLRLLNNPATMQAQPLNAWHVWREYDTIMSDGRFMFRTEPDRVEIVLRELTSGAQIAHKMWPDAYLAAFAIAAGLQFVTFDRGFRQFTDLDLLLLGDSQPY